MAFEAIKTVDGQSLLVQPSQYRLIYSDQSSEDAGRTEDGTMIKSRIGTVVGIDLGWQNLATEQGSHVINLFWPEYVDVEFLDLKAGGYITKRFYSGDKNSNLYNAVLGVWEQIQFNIRSEKCHAEDEANG